MELQVSYRVCAKISEEGNFRRKADRNPGNITAIMPMERGRDNRRGSLSRSHTPVVKYPAKDECKQFHGISEREK